MLKLMPQKLRHLEEGPRKKVTAAGISKRRFEVFQLKKKLPTKLRTMKSDASDKSETVNELELQNLSSNH